MFVRLTSPILPPTREKRQQTIENKPLIRGLLNPSHCDNSHIVALMEDENGVITTHTGGMSPSKRVI